MALKTEAYRLALANCGCGHNHDHDGEEETLEDAYQQTPGVDYRLAASRSQKERAVFSKFPPDSKKKGKVMLTGDTAKVLGKKPYTTATLSELSDADLDKLHNLVVGGKKARFEEGKPADPTEEMSEEDAKKWEEMNEEHGDKLKEAGSTLGKGTKVRVPHKGKTVDGTVVRYDKGSPQDSPFYVVDVGEYESLKVSAQKVEKKAGSYYVRYILAPHPRFVEIDSPDQQIAAVFEQKDAKFRVTLVAPGETNVRDNLDGAQFKNIDKFFRRKGWKEVTVDDLKRGWDWEVGPFAPNRALQEVQKARMASEARSLEERYAGRKMSPQEALDELKRTRDLNTAMLEPLGIKFENFLRYSQLPKAKAELMIDQLIKGYESGSFKLPRRASDFSAMSMSDLEKAVSKSFPGSKHNSRQMMLELKDGRMVMFSRQGRGPSAKTTVEVWDGREKAPKKVKEFTVKSVDDAVSAIKKVKLATTLEERYAALVEAAGEFTGQGWTEQKKWLQDAKKAPSKTVSPARAKAIQQAAREKAKSGPWSDQLVRVMEPGEHRYVSDVWDSMPGNTSFVDALDAIAKGKAKTAAEKPYPLSKSDVETAKSYMKRHKGQSHKGYKVGAPFPFQGGKWLIYDFDADADAPQGFTLVLVSPDYQKMVRGVETTAGKTAGLEDGFMQAARKAAKYLESLTGEKHSVEVNNLGYEQGEDTFFAGFELGSRTYPDLYFTVVGSGSRWEVEAGSGLARPELTKRVSNGLQFVSDPHKLFGWFAAGMKKAAATSDSIDGILRKNSGICLDNEEERTKLAKALTKVLGIEAKDIATALASHDGICLDNGSERKRLTTALLQFSRRKQANAAGMYGYPKSIQADCEIAARRVRRAALKLSVSFRDNAAVLTFLDTHARRTGSLAAKAMLSALRETGATVASLPKGSGRGSGMYGQSKSATRKGLKLCTAFMEEVGSIATGLHVRRKAKADRLAGFFETHAKEAGCAYSELLYKSFPYWKEADPSYAERMAAEKVNIIGWVD